MGSTSISYHGGAQEVIEHCCIVCHACYDAPCQLKLEYYSGLVRGANENKVYDGTRLLGASLTRLFEDAETTQEWRDKDFFPVLNERNNTLDANINASVMTRLLLLKQQHPLPQNVCGVAMAPLALQARPRLLSDPRPFVITNLTTLEQASSFLRGSLAVAAATNQDTITSRCRQACREGARHEIQSNECDI